MKYAVDIKVSSYVTVLVDADSPEEAMDFGYDDFGLKVISDYSRLHDSEPCSVEKVIKATEYAEEHI